jgi:hypothetical protein
MRKKGLILLTVTAAIAVVAFILKKKNTKHFPQARPVDDEYLYV